MSGDLRLVPPVPLDTATDQMLRIALGIVTGIAAEFPAEFQDVADAAARRQVAKILRQAADRLETTPGGAE